MSRRHAPTWLHTGRARLLPSRPGRAARGFTLLEVLATMLLMAIVLPAAMSAITVCTTTAAVARARLEAATLAEGKLQEIACDPNAGSGTLSGDFAPDFPDYRWVAQVDTRDTALSEITVHVQWALRGHDYDIALTTLQYTATGGAQ